MKKNPDFIIDFLSIEKGINVSKYEKVFVEQTIQTRILKTKCESVESYFLLLKENPVEISRFLDSLTVSYSEFFRNPLTFSVLEKILLPEMISNKRLSNQKEIRIWSTACAAGQEAYTLSILLNESLKSNLPAIEFRIFASDSSDEQVQLAKKGVYKNRALKNVSTGRLSQWFRNQTDEYVVKDTLKRNIDFSVFDLLDDNYSSPPTSIFGGFDIVFCANILFYYSSEYRKCILDKVSKSLSANGLLITGETERDLLIQYGFSEVFPYSSIFRKKD